MKTNEQKLQTILQLIEEVYETTNKEEFISFNNSIWEFLVPKVKGYNKEITENYRNLRKQFQEGDMVKMINANGLEYLLNREFRIMSIGNKKAKCMLPGDTRYSYNIYLTNLKLA